MRRLTINVLVMFLTFGLGIVVTAVRFGRVQALIGEPVASEPRIAAWR